MDHTFVDEKSLKTLEDYAVFLTTGMLSLMTLQNFQVRAIKIGILPEDMMERANVIIWDIRRQIQSYQAQLESVLEMLPDNFSAVPLIEKLKAKESSLMRSMTKKLMVKK